MVVNEHTDRYNLPVLKMCIFECLTIRYFVFYDLQNDFPQNQKHTPDGYDDAQVTGN